MSHHPSRQASASTLSAGGATRHDVEKLIQKDRLKDAVKQAKLLMKKEATPENRSLLERAYFLRARQLLALRMSDSAIEVARHLAELGVSSAELADEFVRLLMSLGLFDLALEVQAKSVSSELKDQLGALAADQAVIHPERLHGIPEETAREARLIRESLEKLCAGDSEGGLLLLRDLPRSSLLSDWKFFVRGLAARYQGNALDSSANWDRLDRNRAACRIANRLRPPGQLEGQNSGDAALPGLEREAFGEPVLAPLAELQGLVIKQQWRKVGRILASLRKSLARLDRTFPERLTRILIWPLIRHASELDSDDALEVLETFTRAAEPLSIDPNWNRFWAIASVTTQDQCEVTRGLWVKYINDLKTIPAFSADERALARALVWNRVATLYRDEAESLEHPQSMFGMLENMFMNTSDPAALDRLEKRTLECVEKSLALAPHHLPTYRMLIDVKKRCKDQAGLEKAARRLLERFPDDLETLSLLTESTFKQDRLDEAMSYIKRSRTLKPLDPALRELEATIHVGLAHQCAIAGRWDEGREQFRAAEAIAPDLRQKFYYLARKALFEAKASSRDESDRFMREAEAALAEPTALYLALAIESRRYSLTAATTKGYEKLWTEALKKKCTSQTAGEMASQLDAYRQLGVDYPGQAKHVGQVQAYLKRTKRLKYRQIDIERVCEFLSHVVKGEDQDLLVELVISGVNQHPKSAQLNFKAGLLSLAQFQPPFIPSEVVERMEKALELAQGSNSPADKALVPEIKTALTLINELGEMTASMPLGGGFLPFGPGAPGAIDDWGFGGLDDFWDDVDLRDPLPRPLPKTGPKKQRKSKKQ